MQSTKALLLAGVATGLILAQMAGWYLAQDGLSVSGGGAQGVPVFFATELALALLLVASLVYFGKTLAGSAKNSLGTVEGVIGSSLASKKDLRIGVVAGLVYVALYSVVSGILVYQPTVNFSQVYGVSSPSAIYSPCCGALGGTPSLYLYLPEAHLALQVLPADLLMLVTVPFLVGLNVLVASFALRNRPTGTGAAWLGGMGAIVGLFTSCPTCAGYFLAGAFGGIGASSAAVVLAGYQLLFVLLSVPLLVVSPLLVGASLKRAFLASCRLPDKG